MARKKSGKLSRKREDILEEKVRPGLHKKIKKVFKKEHPGKKMSHHQEHELEERVSRGVHKKVKKIANKKSKKGK